MLEHRGESCAALLAAPNSSAAVDDRRDVRRESFGVEARDGLTVDQQPVAAEHDRRFDPFALPDGGDQITDPRHAALPGKVVRSITSEGRCQASNRLKSRVLGGMLRLLPLARSTPLTT